MLLHKIQEGHADLDALGIIISIGKKQCFVDYGRYENIPLHCKDSILKTKGVCAVAHDLSTVSICHFGGSEEEQIFNKGYIQTKAILYLGGLRHLYREAKDWYLNPERVGLTLKHAVKHDRNIQDILDKNLSINTYFNSIPKYKKLIETKSEHIQEWINRLGCMGGTMALMDEGYISEEIQDIYSKARAAHRVDCL